jgi:hypothetical protein
LLLLLQEVRFIETAFTRIGRLTLVVVWRLKCQTDTFNSRGGKLVSAVDPRVGVHVPKGAYRFSAQLSMKVAWGRWGLGEDLRGLIEGYRRMVAG